jgi:chromosome segregation ATPase
MFSRGVVHPLDLHHESNPPSNPELLALLAQELKSNGFLLRPVLRAIALSRTYQRSCESPSPETLNYSDIAARCLQMKTEFNQRQSELPSLKTVVQLRDAEYRDALRQFDAQTAEIASLAKAVADATQLRDKILAEHEPNVVALEKAQGQLQLISEAMEKAVRAAKAISDDKILIDVAARIAERETHWKAITEPLAEKVAASTKSSTKPCSSATERWSTVG